MYVHQMPNLCFIFLLFSWVCFIHLVQLMSRRWWLLMASLLPTTWVVCTRFSAVISDLSNNEWNDQNEPRDFFTINTTEEANLERLFRYLLRPLRSLDSFRQVRAVLRYRGVNSIVSKPIRRLNTWCWPRPFWGAIPSILRLRIEIASSNSGKRTLWIGRLWSRQFIHTKPSPSEVQVAIHREFHDPCSRFSLAFFFVDIFHQRSKGKAFRASVNSSLLKDVTKLMYVCRPFDPLRITLFSNVRLIVPF